MEVWGCLSEKRSRGGLEIGVTVGALNFDHHSVHFSTLRLKSSGSFPPKMVDFM